MNKPDESNWNFVLKADPSQVTDVVTIKSDESVTYADGISPATAWRAAGTRIHQLEQVIDEVCRLLCVDSDHAEAISKHGEGFRHQLLMRSIAQIQSHHTGHHDREGKQTEALERLAAWFQHAGVDDFNNVEPVDADNALALINAALGHDPLPTMGPEGYPLDRSPTVIAKLQDHENTIQLLQAKLREMGRR